VGMQVFLFLGLGVGGDRIFCVPSRCGDASFSGRGGGPNGTSCGCGD
jgi:hypothetical protein